MSHTLAEMSHTPNMLIGMNLYNAEAKIKSGISRQPWTECSSRAVGHGLGFFSENQRKELSPKLWHLRDYLDPDNPHDSDPSPISWS